jgi:hypothetical protein
MIDHNFQGLGGDMLAAGSEQFVSVVPPPDSDATASSTKTLNATCHQECSSFGCYGPNSTDCVACKNFNLNELVPF